MAEGGNSDSRNSDLRGLMSEKEWAGIGGFLGKTRYVCCPWKKFDRPHLLNLAKWKFATPNNNAIPTNEEELDKVLPILEVDDSKLFSPPVDKIQVTWIGHATVLVQFDGITILSDPVFREFCGPGGFLKATGFWRYRKAACRIMDIQKLDAVIISHNHYDHLENAAVTEIAERFPHVIWFVTCDQKQWMISKGANPDKVVELDWWEEKKIKLNGQDFRFICTPTQHWCQRRPLDMNKALWCSWVVKGPAKSYYFAGDTGYYKPLFETIGNKHGPFDLAVLPIGCYEPRWILQYQHVDPGEAVSIHEDVKAKCSVGMHWGTFKTMACEFFLEPPQKVEEEMVNRGHDPLNFVCLCHGETWCVGDTRKRSPFMDVKPPK